MLIFFSLTLFISAFLLFWLELMIAKMILPLLGGSPSVWNTCLFFFQTTLLLGYGYSHLTTKWLGVRRQSIIHTFVILTPIIFLPITLSKGWFSSSLDNPIVGVLFALILSVGCPLFTISTSAPLIQKWFSHTTHSRSSDPYFLYSASNFGSLLGVIAYPIFLEPNLSLTRQSLLWAIAYILLFLLTLGCGVILWKGKNHDQILLISQDISTLDSAKSTPTLTLKVQWILLSFLPSSLLLGVTTYLTTDLAAIPLLWAIPLAIYLLTFILSFSRKPFFPNKNLEKILPLLLASLIALSLLKIIEPIWLFLPLHLLGFFGIAGVFHGQLAKSRPNPDYLTSFYFWISLGGVLGGLFNAIAAPLLFPTVLEYPLMLGLSLMLLGIATENELKPKIETEKLEKEIIIASLLKGDRVPNSLPNHNLSNDLLQIKQSLILISSIFLLACFLLTGFQIKYFNSNLIGIIFSISLLFLINYGFNLSKIRFVTSLILIILISQFYLPSMGSSLVTERSFFGVNRVLYNQKENYHSLFHGTTLHGKQSLDRDRRNEPLTYFYKTGPIGQVFQSFNASHPSAHVGVLGLGIGTLVSYGKPEQDWTFYEIDPSVKKLASDPQYFTFLKDAKSPFSIILGDGRLSIKNAPQNYYDLLIMDAFSSDSIPTHLVTKEAIQLYLEKLNQTGLLAINISNRHINLEPVLGALAKNLDLSTLIQLELNISPSEKALGKSPSHWVILAKNPSNFRELVNDPRWQAIAESSPDFLWTDDFSNIFQVLRIFQPGKSL